MHTQTGDPMEYEHIPWRSDGLCTQPLDRMDYAQKPGDLMDYEHTAWRS